MDYFKLKKLIYFLKKLFIFTLFYGIIKDIKIPYDGGKYNV